MVRRADKTSDTGKACGSPLAEVNVGGLLVPLDDHEPPPLSDLAPLSALETELRRLGSRRRAVSE